MVILIYDRYEAAEQSLTVAELIKVLSEHPATDRVVFSNDGGYTYGNVGASSVISKKN